jgi:hypothetical protein
MPGAAQHAKVYLTFTPAGGPDGEQRLTPLRLYPRGDRTAILTWPVLELGIY